MVNRCTNTKHRDYKQYGAKGVRVASVWADKEVFIRQVRQLPNWEHKLRDPRGWQLDKDLLCPGNKVYGPDTCLWLPRSLNSALSGGALLHTETGRVYLGVKDAGSTFGMSNTNLCHYVERAHKPAMYHSWFTVLPLSDPRVKAEIQDRWSWLELG